MRSSLLNTPSPCPAPAPVAFTAKTEATSQVSYHYPAHAQSSYAALATTLAPAKSQFTVTATAATTAPSIAPATVQDTCNRSKNTFSKT